jgi:hypothetical protein
LLTHESNIQKDLAIRSIKHLEFLASIKTLPLNPKNLKHLQKQERKQMMDEGRKQMKH